MKPLSEMSKRGPTLCGKVPSELYESARKMIDGKKFKTMNDLVEVAIWCYVNEKEIERIEGGHNLA